MSFFLSTGLSFQENWIFHKFSISGTGIYFKILKEGMESGTMKRDQKTHYEVLS
jgi:hypothetical protein